MKTRFAVTWAAGKPSTIERINEGFGRMARGESTRSVVVY